VVNTGGSQGWNIVKILGKTSVKAKTSNFIFSSKVKNCPFANNAGAEYPTETGEDSAWKIFV
jgi:hypothetical protein